MSRTVPESKLFLFAISNFVLLGITSKVSLFGIKGKFLSQSMPHGALRTSNHYKFQQAEGQRAPCYSRTRLKTNNRRHFDTKHNNTAIKPTLPAGSYAELRGRPPHRRSALRTARSSALPRGVERSSAAGTAAEERPHGAVRGDPAACPRSAKWPPAHGAAGPPGAAQHGSEPAAAPRAVAVSSRAGLRGKHSFSSSCNAVFVFIELS